MPLPLRISRSLPLLAFALLGLVLWACGASFEERVVDASPPTDPWMKAIGDLNGDGKPDLVLCGRNGPLVWYENPSWTRRTISTATGSGGTSNDVAVADVDRNGSLDVVLANGVWFSNPRPSGDVMRDSWARHQIDQTTAHDVVAIDLDRDGDVDVVKRNQGATGDVIRIFRQESGDTWTERDLVAPAGEGLDVGDLDGDGDLDIAIGGAWYENSGNIVSGAWTKRTYTSAWTFPNAVVRVANLIGSSRPEIVLSPSESQGQSYRLSFFESPADPKGLWTEHVLRSPAEAVIHGLAVADFDRDGLPDIAFAEMHQGADPDEVGVFYQRGPSSFQYAEFSEGGSHDIAVADLNGDGRPDLFGANWSTQQAPDHAAAKIWINR